LDREVGEIGGRFIIDFEAFGLLPDTALPGRVARATPDRVSDRWFSGVGRAYGLGLAAVGDFVPPDPEFRDDPPVLDVPFLGRFEADAVRG
jgi:hypothetical protein